MRVTLSTERAEDNAPLARGLGCGDCVPTDRVHLFVLVALAGQGPRVRIVSVGWDGRVVDHGGFEVEAAVAEVEDCVDFGVGELW